MLAAKIKEKMISSKYLGGFLLFLIVEMNILIEIVIHQKNLEYNI